MASTRNITIFLSAVAVLIVLLPGAAHAQEEVASTATKLLAEDPDRGRVYLTLQSRQACAEVTQSYWNLGDLLWTKYDEKW